MEKIICVAGPTASGKTKLALAGKATEEIIYIVTVINVSGRV